MAGPTITIGGITNEICHCITCGIPFGVPLTVIKKHREYGGYHSCPNGHLQGWSKEGSEVDRLRRQTDELRRERDRAVQQIAQRAACIGDLDKQLKAERRERKRVTTRANNGVCQDCHRTFSNLLRHRATKHKLTYEPTTATRMLQ